MHLGLVCILSLVTSTVLAAGGGDGGGSHGGGKKHFTIYEPKEPNKSLATRPDKVELKAPAFEAQVSNNAELSWKAPEGVSTFHLQVATDVNFKWLVVNEPMYQADSYVLNNLEANKHYYWRVAALKPENDPGYIKSFFASSMFATR